MASVQCDATTTWEMVGGHRSAPIRCAYAAGHSGEHLFSTHDETDAIRYKLASDERDRLRSQLAAANAARDAAVAKRDGVPTT